MKYFTRKISIQSDPDKISFTITKLRDETEEQKHIFQLYDIESYQIQFPNNRFACLILKLKSGKRKEVSFYKQFKNLTQDSPDVILEKVHEYFGQHEIKFAPSFYASQKGLYIIIFLVVLLFVCFIIVFSMGKNLPATILISFILITHVIIRRVNDLNFYNKWKKF